MSIDSEIQLLEPSGLVELFELDCTDIGGDILYFHGYTRNGNVTWQGTVYKPWPIEPDGFGVSGEAQQPSPTLQVGNVDGSIAALCSYLNDLLGAKLTRRRTLVKFLDAVNFPDGVNAEADPTAHFPDDIWYVEQKSNANKTVVEFTMKSALDLSDMFLPKRIVIANLCPWAYRSADCGYAGGAVADENDVATSDLSKDKCGKRVGSCKLRFGANGPLPFGGFAGASLNR